MSSTCVARRKQQRPGMCLFGYLRVNPCTCSLTTDHYNLSASRLGAASLSSLQ